MRGPSRYFNYCNLKIFNDCLEDLGFSRISIAFFKECESICIHMRLTMTVGYTCSPWVTIPGFVIVCLTLKFDCWPFRMEVESITHILLWTINHLCWPLFIVFSFFAAFVPNHSLRDIFLLVSHWIPCSMYVSMSAKWVTEIAQKAEVNRHADISILLINCCSSIALNCT